jgi:hypothetical protein
LREALAQILGDRSTVLEERESRVVAHRGGRLSAGRKHADDVLELLARTAEAQQLTVDVAVGDRFDLV